MQLPASARLGAIALIAAVGACATHGSEDGWTTLVDGTRGLDNFTRLGDANWSGVDGAIQATQGGKDAAYLVSKDSYRDFQIHAEFWASDDANSGIFMRCQDRAKVSDETCYEANVYDQRPDPSYGTGALTKFVKVIPMPKAGGRWNTYDITVQGSHIVLIFNGQKTVDTHDSKFAGGPIALQWGRGTIKFRKVEIKPL